MPTQEQSVPMLTAFAFSSTGVFQNFKKCLFKYNNREYVLHVGTPEYCDVIQTYIKNNNNYNEIFSDINNFFNNLGWLNGCGFQYETDCGVGRLNTDNLFQESSILQNEKRNSRINLVADFTYIIKVPTPEATIALSLYNDAQFTSNYFFKFLCLFKTLEINYPNKSLYASQWINQIIKSQPSLANHDFIKDMITKQENIGKYFYQECRNTIAHMDREEKMLSFNVEDYRKIRVACSAIEPFVRYFIQHELGLPKYASKIEILQIE